MKAQEPPTKPKPTHRPKENRNDHGLCLKICKATPSPGGNEMAKTIRNVVRNVPPFLVEAKANFHKINVISTMHTTKRKYVVDI